jgi:hypothetical protein
VARRCRSQSLAGADRQSLAGADQESLGGGDRQCLGSDDRELRESAIAYFSELPKQQLSVQR